MVGRSRRRIISGAVRVAFIVRKDIARIPVQPFNTPRGTMLVSTPEATAFDLVGYPHQVGGLDQIATILEDLAEKLDPDKLVAVAEIAPMPWTQQLGYLLERVEAHDKVGPLRSYVGARAADDAFALHRARRGRCPRRRLETPPQCRRGARAVIPRDYVTEWRAQAPWVQDVQVEQDLVISRALVEIFSDPVLSEALAFRGGTALYKLYLTPAARYSEDIDLVQMTAEPAGAAMDALHAVLDPWLGKPRWKQTAGRVTMVYRFDSEDAPPLPMRLKVEINTREHFAVHGFHRAPSASPRAGSREPAKFRPTNSTSCWGQSCGRFISAGGSSRDPNDSYTQTVQPYGDDG